MNIDNINFNNIKFSNIYSNNNSKYALSYYGSKNLELTLLIPNFRIYELTKSDNVYFCKFSIDKNTYKCLLNLEKHVIDYIKKNNFINLKNHNISIKDLFFSNLEKDSDKYFLNISIDNNLYQCLNKDINYNGKIKIIGIWIYEQLYGISYQLISYLNH